MAEAYERAAAETRPTEETKDFLRQIEGEDYESVFDDVSELVKYLGQKSRALRIAMQAYEYDMQVLKSEIHDLKVDVDALKKARVEEVEK